MNIVLLTQWFPPEQAPIGYMIKELGEALVSRGHDVTVVTAFPNHPGGVVFGGYEKRWKLIEKYERMQVIRNWLATSPKRSFLRRILSFCTFTLTSSLAILGLKRPTIIFAVFQPLSVAITLPLLAKIKGAKLIFNVQDLHPDVPIELGMIKNRVLIAFLKALERFGYRQADVLTVLCDTFSRHCVARGATPAKVVTIPNWIDVQEICPGDRNNSFRIKLGLTTNDFVVLYAGTVGWVAGADVVLTAAEQLRDMADVKFVFVGEGPAVSELRLGAQARGLSNVIFAPFQPRELLSQVQAVSDVSVVSLKPGKGRASVPSKVLGYMAAARPVLASVDRDSETANIILKSGAGSVVSPGSGTELAVELKKLYRAPGMRAEMGARGRRFLQDNFSKDAIVGKYVNFFEGISGAS